MEFEFIPLEKLSSDDEITDNSDNPSSYTNNLKKVSILSEKSSKRQKKKQYFSPKNPTINTDYFSIHSQENDENIKKNSGLITIPTNNNDEENDEQLDPLSAICGSRGSKDLLYKTKLDKKGNDVTEEVIEIIEKKGPETHVKDVKEDVEKDSLSKKKNSNENPKVMTIIQRIQQEKKRISSTESDPYLKKIPPNGLLNLYDSEFIKIKIVTYNLQGNTPQEAERFYHLFQSDTQHMYIVGTQECERSTGGSFFNTSKAKWMKIMRSCFSLRYIPLASSTLVATNLVVFIRKELKRYIKNVSVYTIPVGKWGFFGDKGSTIISFDFGRTSFLYINAHLTNKDYNIDKRCADYHKIMKVLENKICKKKKLKSFNIFEEFDHVFFFGDLNFRVNGIRSLANKLIEVGMLDVLLANDQLGIARRRKKAFDKFKEEKVSFLPTFKFDPGTDLYDTAKKQHVPSWCDRILYHSKEKIIPLEYNADFCIKLSDHRPVYGRFLCYVDATPLEPPEPDEVYEDSKSVRKKRNISAVCKFL